MEKKIASGANSRLERELAEKLNEARAYQWGFGGEVDFSRARRLFRECAQSHSRRIASQGHYELGLFYYYGFGVERDLGRAFNFFMKSVLVFPNRAALTKLGDMYRYGQFVDQNDAVSLSLYVKANQA